MNKVRIENWSVCHSKHTSLHCPPETWEPCLQGKVFGHPKRVDGHNVATSPITKVDGRTITTRSGTVYELGEVDPVYVEHCRKQGWVVPTDEIPIKSL